MACCHVDAHKCGYDVYIRGMFIVDVCVCVCVRIKVNVVMCIG